MPPILNGISFEELIERKVPKFNGLSFEHFHEPNRFRFMGLSLELEPTKFSLRVTHKNQAIGGALCVVSVEGEEYTYEDITELGGIAVLDYDVAKINTLTITANGFQTYKMEIFEEVFRTLDLKVELNKTISAYTQPSTGQILVNPDPANPENSVII